MDKNFDIKLTDEILSVQACYDYIQSPDCGGIALFVGTVRNQSQQKEVIRLDFSSYKPMAIKEMERIAEWALADYEISKIAIHHAVGSLNVGDIPVIIAVSSPHRKAAFKACQFTIDTLKERVPIWKKEFFVDGDVWVNATP